MTATEVSSLPTIKPRHNWLHRVHVAFVPGPMDSLSEEVADGIMRKFEELGHVVQAKPSNETDIILTTAQYGEPLNWRKSLVLTARARFKLKRNPTVYTLLHMTPAQLSELMARFERALAKEPPDPADFEFPGLNPTAYHVLVEQGRRGGPILSIQRLLQAQAKGIRLLLVVGDDAPDYVYHFDLVGAYPKSVNSPLEDMYEDIVLRMVTTVSTHEVTDHEVVDAPIPYEVWRHLETPQAMITASAEFGKRNFFTDMVRINDLVSVPAVAGAVASQYSEGCFATWDPHIQALIATITGSARPVDKDNLTEDELAVLTGVRPGGVGAYVRHVEGKVNDPPSSEAVEMVEIDLCLPRIHLDGAWGVEAEVPVVRSKLHGHRGVAAYDPRFVEYAPLDPPYFHYLVSCATAAQAKAVKTAFCRAEALCNPHDPRQIVFTVLPGHGLMVVEKWIPGKKPFQAIWEAMDAGYFVVDSHVPQGPLQFVPDAEGMMRLVESEH
ncbi:MAG: hypothetical protein GXP42_03680 [Chloroflexi bacterium]|nr:hypothetical protein [Chloroflexota bacterium]